MKAKSEDIITLNSKAYPSNLYYFPVEYDLSKVKKRKIKHNIHTILRMISHNCKEFNISSLPVEYNILNENSLRDISSLQKEWFPVNYSDDYIKNIINRQNSGETIILGATINLASFIDFYTIDENEEDDETIEDSILIMKEGSSKNTQTKKNHIYIVGLVMITINKITNFKSECKSKVNSQLIKSRSCFKECWDPLYSAYINTLGVIDEFRKLKLGSKLLERSISLILSSINIIDDSRVVVSPINKKIRNKIVSIYLHVIEFNAPAIKFYEKNDFTEYSESKDYYCLKNKFFNAKVFCKILREEYFN